MRPMAGANSEECSSPPPAKKTRANNAPPAKATVMQYGRWAKPSSSTLLDPMQPVRKPKREWANSYNAEAPPTQAFSRVSEAVPAAEPYDIAGPAAQEINVTGPSTLQHTLPGPLIAAPSTLGQEVTLQHALPGPSGTQAQTDYANVSIFFLPIYFFQCFSPFQSQYKLIAARY